MVCVVLTLCLVLAAKGGESPDELHIWIGGHEGPSYDLRLTNNVLHYWASGRGMRGTGKKPEVITPTDGQWKTFRTALDQVGIWNWRTNYVDSRVCDGTQWGVAAKYGEKQITVYGSNAYPDGNNPEPSPTFKKFLRAIEQLLSGREFK